MDLHQRKRYTVTLCEHIDTKPNCGKILKKFTETLDSSEAATFMYDIITLDFFKDLNGSMNEFYLEFESEEIIEMLKSLISENHEVNSQNEIVESDEDSVGNLRFF
jgi:hypothetical protein